MLNTTTKSLLTLAAFGLSTLLVGGYMGGEMARRQHVKEDIKAIQLEHAKTLARIDSVVQQAAENERATLAQIDSVYSILGELNAKEGKTRSNINATAARINQMQKGADKIKIDIKTVADDSEITFKTNPPN